MALALLVALTGAGTAGAQGTPKRGGTLRVALTGEPPTIDVHQTGATLVLNIAWHMAEPLFTLDRNFGIIPMLAEGYDLAPDKLTYTIRLRRHVPFHNGQTMTADDVVASVQRWGKLAAVGKALFANVESLRAKDPATVELKVKQSSGIVIASLANPNQMAAIYPKSVIDASGEKPIRDIVGTGPFQLKEWIPDRHVRVTRFDRYAALPGEPNGYGGRKTAHVDEVFFVPSSEPASRVLGVEAGDFDLADWIPSDAYERLVKLPGVTTLVVKPKEWIIAPFNQKPGKLFQSLELRQAAQAAIDVEKVMQAAIGRPEFFRLDPGLMFREQVWHSTAGQELYNQKNPARAKELMKKAGYAGQEIKWITTKEYEWMYRSSLAAVQQLQDVGFTIKLDVVDWGSVLKNRQDYDVFVTGMVVWTDPTQVLAVSCAWVGWYCEERHVAMMKELALLSDFKARKALWDRVQAHFYQQAASLRFGDFFSLRIHRKGVHGFANGPELYVWNVWKD
jgi:peptide/nickel transport system substrate-binding protein